MDTIQRQLDQCDFVRFTFADIHGIQRGKAVPRKHVNRMMKEGVAVFSGMIVYGPRSQLLAEAMEDTSNVLAKPIIDTFHMLPWSGDGIYKVGEFMCETSLADGRPQLIQPRYVARKQLDQLRSEHGITIKSGWEEEFIIVDKESQEPLFQGVDYLTHLLLAENERLLFDLQSLMEKGGIDVEALSNEYSSGQYEFSTAPVDGIRSADIDFSFKQAAKEICLTRGKQAIFMTKPILGGNSNGKHFNLSLWNAEAENVFYDGNAELKISQFACHWLAGLIKHAPAMAALCSPTVNCYRRLHSPWAPDLANWGMDDRNASFRIKNLGPAGTYLENRLPSSAANPYLVMAATVAAGMDGVRNKMEVPAQGQADAVRLPDSLDEALKELEADQSMVDALGEEFVCWFIKVKRDIELKELEGFDRTNMDPAFLKKERKQYYKFI